ncbi:MAG: hypothetical protein FJ088_04785 [Deltaproteobacteria bacterium]|nr:hypothetical protein [Deltaproteobacteria bacterium]
MPFDYLHPNIPGDFMNKIKTRFVEMHLREIRERAHLLRNLRYSKDRAASRIKNNIAWEFELSKIPSFIKEVDRLVSEVYGK